MRNGDIEFQQIVEDSERAVKQMAACGLGYSAKAIKELIRYTKALDKNQKALIKGILKLQQANNIWDKTGDLMFSYLTTPQKFYVKERTEELKKEMMSDDSARID